MFMFTYDYSASSTGIIIVMLLTIVVGVVGLASIIIEDIISTIKKKGLTNEPICAIIITSNERGIDTHEEHQTF